MAKASLLPRGFKAKAERTALALRKELGFLPTDPLCGFKLDPIPQYFLLICFP